MTGLLPSMPRPHGKEVYGKSYLEMYLLFPQLITLTYYRAILQCFVVISNEAIMVPPYSLFIQAALYHLQLLPKTILFAMYIVLTQQQVHIIMQTRSIGNADALAASACELQVQSHGEATSSESV